MGWRSVKDYFGVVGSLRYEVQPDARRFENWETNYAGLLGVVTVPARRAV